MAEKNKEDHDKDVAVNADKSKPVIIMLIVLAILVLVFTPFVTILALKAFIPQEEPGAKEKEIKGTEIPLEAFKFNVAQSQGTRFAMVTVVVEVSDAQMANLFQNHSAENPQGMGNRIRAEILDMLSERNLDGLLSKEARNTLRKEIQSKINNILSEQKVKGVVTDVYFPSFLVQ